MSCWILSQYRSGSTYLCYLLNSTKLFEPKFNEYFHFGNEFSFLRKIYKYDYQYQNDIEQNNIRDEIFFNIKRGKISLPKYCKIHREQYLEIFNNDQKDKKDIESYLPNMKYIWLERSNIYEKTISNFFSNYTRIWSLHKNNIPNIRNYYSNRIPFCEKKILHIYERNLSMVNNSWENYLLDSKYLKIDYDNLIKKPFDNTKNILDFLEMNYSGINFKKIIDECPFIKMKRAETDEYINRLKKIIEG